MKQPRYDQEFKLRAVKQALSSGLSMYRAAQELGVSDTTLSNWIKAYEQNGEASFPGSGRLTPAEEEVRVLKKKLKEAEIERDILKKATAFFAKEQ